MGTARAVVEHMFRIYLCWSSELLLLTVAEVDCEWDIGGIIVQLLFIKL